MGFLQEQLCLLMRDNATRVPLHVCDCSQPKVLVVSLFVGALAEHQDFNHYHGLLAGHQDLNHFHEALGLLAGC